MDYRMLKIKWAFLSVLILFVQASFAVSVEELAELQKDRKASKGMTLIDIRQPYEYAKGHIPGAINIPVHTLKVRRLPKFTNVIIYGDGLSAEKVNTALAEIDSQLGIEPKNLEGGFSSWQKNKVMSNNLSANTLSFKELMLADIKEMADAGQSMILISLKDQSNDEIKVNLSSYFPMLTIVVAELVEGGVKDPHAFSSFQLPSHYTVSPKQLYIVIDEGNGEASKFILRLKGLGAEKVAVLSGGYHAFETPEVKTIVKGGVL